MKVQELVVKYEKNPRIDIAKEIETQPYVSIALKREMAQLVLDNCTTIIDGEVHINSVEKYILFTTAVIAMHTNIEFSGEDNEHDVIDGYDTLCKSGLLIKIIDTFKDDYAACQEILNMMTADKMQESLTIEKKMSQLLDGIQNLLGDIIGGLVEQLNIGDSMKNLPVDQTKLLELFSSVE